MRHFIRVSFGAAALAGLTACGETTTNEDVERAFQEVNVIDETNLNEVMLTVGDPNEAVKYFQRTLQQSPDRIDLHRGLARSLTRAKRTSEAHVAWAKVVDHPESDASDRVELADALIRNNNWDEAEIVLQSIPPTYETHKRYRLEAMIADANEDWKRADAFYETAVGLTSTPAGTLNNWGFSKLTRGAHAEAERLFLDALRHDKSLFTSKNNLALARGAQGNYTLPVIEMSQVERAQLLHTLGLAAVKRGDVETGKGLLRDALDSHPQHFEAADRALMALDGRS